MSKFQDEAKAQGIELPAILTSPPPLSFVLQLVRRPLRPVDMDPESGLPAAFDVKEADLEEWKEENKEAIMEPKLLLDTVRFLLPMPLPCPQAPLPG